MLEVHAILHRQRCYENMTEKTGTLSDAYELTDIAAYRKMKKWISLCPGLLQRLYDLGYESKRRSFTPLEVRVIVDALGEP